MNAGQRIGKSPNSPARRRDAHKAPHLAVRPLMFFIAFTFYFTWLEQRLTVGGFVRLFACVMALIGTVAVMVTLVDRFDGRAAAAGATLALLVLVVAAASLTPPWRHVPTSGADHTRAPAVARVVHVLLP